MNSKTNRTLFIIIALLGSVKNSYANSNQLAIKSTHVGKVNAFESSNPFAVLSEIESEPNSLGSLSEASQLKRLKPKRRKKKRSNLNIEAEETHLTNQTNKSRLGMPSAKEIVPKGLAYFVAGLGFLNGVQGISSDCDGHGYCYTSGLNSCHGTNPYWRSYQAGKEHSFLVGCVTAGSIALGIAGCFLACLYRKKKQKQKDGGSNFA